MISSNKALKILRSMFNAAVEAADPVKCITQKLFLPPEGKIIVIGAGKASGMMAKAVETNWSGDISGLVVTPYGYGVSCNNIEVVEAGHPLPDSMGAKAARRIYKLVQNSNKNDMILSLFSGGGSSLLTMPANGITLAQKKVMNNALLRSGATITEINTVRKHLSKIKGGQLAKIAGNAKIVNLLISDVSGDDPSVIASGPTVPDSSTFKNAQNILKKYKIIIPPTITTHLNKAKEETPKPGDPIFNSSVTKMVATPAKSLRVAAQLGEKLGYFVHSLGDQIEGEARIVGKEHARLAIACKKGGGPVRPPCVLLSGGETTVTISGEGRGGPNTEYLMGLMLELRGEGGIYAIACDTDGIDGSEDNAGSIITPNSLIRAKEANINPQKFLRQNDAYSFFKKLGDLIITGPTFTNVNDFRAILILS